MQPHLQYKRKKKGGYALYLSIILTSLLLIVAYSAANLTFKQLSLVTSSADSHLAFYNADTGLECAMYWDLKNPNAVPPGSASAFDPSAPSATVTCNNTSSAVSTTMNGATSTSTFQINFSTGCATVSVAKDTSNGLTAIQSRGYNRCSGGSRLERGVRIVY